MKRIDFIIKLIIPLSILSVIFVGVAYIFDWNSFFINLAAGVVVVFVTVGYVDWIIKKHESSQWEGVKNIVSDRLTIFINATISGIRESLGYDMNFLFRIDETDTLDQMHEKLMIYARQKLAPRIRVGLETLDATQWEKLARHLSSTMDQINKEVNLFQRQFKPAVLEILLNIQVEIRNGLSFYSLFPELFVPPGEDLPKTKTPPENLRRYGYDQAAQGIQNIFSLLEKLDNEIKLKKE